MFESIKSFFTKSKKNVSKNSQKIKTVEENNQDELNTKNILTKSTKKIPKIKQLKKKYKNSPKFS